MDEKTIKETLLKGERVMLECKRAKAEVSEGVSNRVSVTAKAIYSHIKADPNIRCNRRDSV